MIIKTPLQSDYRKIADLVNSADQIFHTVYSADNAKEMGVGQETVEGLQLGERTRQYLCVFENQVPVAFVSYRVKNPQTVWISSLFVNPSIQRKGYGAELLKRVEQEGRGASAKVAVLETETKATWAINFYLKNGYKILSTADLRQAPFDQVIDKEPVLNRYILGKVL